MLRAEIDVRRRTMARIDSDLAETARELEAIRMQPREARGQPPVSPQLKRPRRERSVVLER
jgi:hypothetical protein